MANFAIIEGTNVLNIIVADSKATAEEVAGKTCIEFTTETAEPGGTYDPVKKVFIQRKPYLSWVLNADNSWESPVAYPDDNKSYTWNEESLSWDEVTITE